MRGPARPLAVALLVAVAICAAWPSAAAAASTRRCGHHDLGQLEGRVLARGISCARAKRVLRRFSLERPPARGWQCYRGASLQADLPVAGGAGCAKRRSGRPRRVAEVVFPR